MTVFYIIHNEALIRLKVGAALGSGGEGCVYPIIEPIDWQGFCVKAYVDKYRTQEKQAKIQFMLEQPPAELDSSYGKLCWPVAIAYDAGFSEFVGFVMPQAYGDSQQLYLLSNLSNKRLGGGWQSYFDQSVNSFAKRLEIGVSLCAVINLLYQDDNYTIVDFKPENLMFTVEGKVALVDMDSIQIRADWQGLPHYGRVNTIGYTPPEGTNITVRNTLVDKTWDEFSLAVILYQLMFGIHPYMATFKAPYAELNSLGDKIQQNLFVHGQGQFYLSALPPLHRRFKDLPHDIQGLFKISFDNNTQQRTSAQLWEASLSQYLATQPFRSQRVITTLNAKMQGAKSKSISAFITTIHVPILYLLSLFSKTINRFKGCGFRFKSNILDSTFINKTKANSQTTHSNKAAQPSRHQASSLSNKNSNYQKRSYINDKPPVNKSVRPAKMLLNFSQFKPNPNQQRPLPITQPKKVKPSLSTRIAQSSIVKFLDDPMAIFCLIFFIVGLVMLLDAVISDSEPSNHSVTPQTMSTAAEPVIVENDPIKDITEKSIFDTDIAGKAINAPDAEALIEAGITPLPGPALPDKIKVTLSPDKRYEVLMKVTTDSSGYIENVEILMPSYNALLDLYTLNTFQNMTFQTQTPEGQTIARDMIFLIYYQQ